MLSVDNSHLLARKMQYAIYNNDIEMIKKIENIKNENEITEDILNYKIKE